MIREESNKSDISWYYFGCIVLKAKHSLRGSHDFVFGHPATRLQAIGGTTRKENNCLPASTFFTSKEGIHVQNKLIASSHHSPKRTGVIWNRCLGLNFRVVELTYPQAEEVSRQTPHFISQSFRQHYLVTSHLVFVFHFGERWAQRCDNITVAKEVSLTKKCFFIRLTTRLSVCQVGFQHSARLIRRTIALMPHTMRNWNMKVNQCTPWVYTIVQQIFRFKFCCQWHDKCERVCMLKDSVLSLGWEHSPSRLPAGMVFWNSEHSSQLLGWARGLEGTRGKMSNPLDTVVLTNLKRQSFTCSKNFIWATLECSQLKIGSQRSQEEGSGVRGVPPRRRWHVYDYKAGPASSLARPETYRHMHVPVWSQKGMRWVRTMTITITRITSLPQTLFGHFCWRLSLSSLRGKTFRTGMAMGR